MELRLRCLTRQAWLSLCVEPPCTLVLLWLEEELSLFTVEFSRSVVSDSLWRHGLQHARLPCPSPLLSVYKEILNVQKHLSIEGRNGHFPGLPVGAPWVWCLLWKPALCGADSASTWQRSLGQLSPGIPTSSSHLPSQNQVVLLIMTHCPWQSASLRMLVHQNVNKLHRKRFHHRVTLEDMVSWEAQHNGPPPWRFTKHSWALKALRSPAAKITKSQNAALLHLCFIQSCFVNLNRESLPSHPKLASNSQSRNIYCRTCFMPCSTM